MIKLKYLAAIAALTGALALSAGAATITNLSPGNDISKNGTGPGGSNANSPAANFFRLQTFLAANPNLANCTPVFAGAFEGTSNLNVDVTGFDFAVVHFGAGKGGTKGSGGGVEFFSVSGTGTVNFPANGTGKNGFGGFSSISLFTCGGDNHVPDGGATAMLLGGALTGVGLVRRYMKR